MLPGLCLAASLAQFAPVFGPGGTLVEPAPLDPFGVLHRMSLTGPCASFPPPPGPRCRLTLKTVWVNAEDGSGFVPEVFRDGLVVAGEADSGSSTPLGAILQTSPTAREELRRLRRHKWLELGLFGVGLTLPITGGLTAGTAAHGTDIGSRVALGLGVAQIVVGVAAWFWIVADYWGPQRASLRRAVDGYDSDLDSGRLQPYSGDSR
ncbi:MAG: hypothetical protein ACYDCL_23365 [Myxococcales bacterium]